MELRCSAKLHCVIDGNVIERTCDSRWCGKRPGLVVVHRWDKNTGEFIGTEIFKDPASIQVKEKC